MASAVVQGERIKWQENAKMALMDDKTFAAYTGQTRTRRRPGTAVHPWPMAQLPLPGGRPIATLLTRSRRRHPQVPQVQVDEDRVHRGADRGPNPNPNPNPNINPYPYPYPNPSA